MKQLSYKVSDEGTMVLFEKHCIEKEPISECFQPDGGFYVTVCFIASLSFFDMVLGVEDPEVFNPPSFCDKAEPGNDAALTSFFDALI